jgi:hypothetical protein
VIIWLIADMTRKGQLTRGGQQHCILRNPSYCHEATDSAGRKANPGDRSGLKWAEVSRTVTRHGKIGSVKLPQVGLHLLLKRYCSSLYFAPVRVPSVIRSRARIEIHKNLESE